MDRLNQVSAYFNEKERRRLETKVKESKSGLPEMTVRIQKNIIQINNIAFIYLAR